MRRVGVDVLVGAIVRELSAVCLAGSHRDPIGELLWAGRSGQAMIVIDQDQSSMRAGDERLGVCYEHCVVGASVHDDDMGRYRCRQRCEGRRRGEPGSARDQLVRRTAAALDLTRCGAARARARRRHQATTQPRR